MGLHKETSLRMQCSACKFDNPGNNKFCGACGQALAPACDQCGFENPAGFSFCGQCGNSLSGAARAVSETSAPERDEIAPRVAERRHLAVLSCGLAQTDTLHARLTPRDFGALVEQYSAAVTAAVERYDGHVAASEGEVLLVYFGYPSAHEDDAQRSLYASLEIIDAVSELNVRAQSTWGVDIAVRVGVHSGETITGEIDAMRRGQDLETGATPEIAAGLQAQAGPGEILLSAQTAAIVAGFFNVEVRGAQQLEGLAKPVEAFRLLSDTNIENRFQVASRHGLSPFAGREQELEAINGSIARVSAGRGEGLCLTGEAGMGKSRLVQHALSQAGTHIESIMLSCSPYHANSQMYPLSVYFARLIGLRSVDDNPNRLRKLETYLDTQNLPREEVVPYLAPILSLRPGGDYAPLPPSPKQIKDRTFAVLSRLLFERQEGKPLVFIVEDLHWVDPSTREFLDHLVLLAPSRPVLLLFTFRPEFDAWRGGVGITILRLQPLPPDAAQKMLMELLRDSFVPAWLHQEIEARTDGVPIFIEELSKMVLNLPAEELSRASSDRGLAQVIPASLQDSLEARLDGLDDAKDALQLASALGRTFSFEILRSIWPRDEAALARHLHRLLRENLLVAEQESQTGHLSFRHALIQDAAYESMLEPRCMQLHGEIAQVLLDQFPDMKERRPELIADHLSRTDQPDRSLPLWLSAGNRALRRSALQEAINLFQRGIAVAEAAPKGAGYRRSAERLHEGLGTAFARVTHWGHPNVAEAIERAEKLYREVGDEAGQFHCMLKLQQAYTSQARHVEAAEHASRALAIATKWDDADALARALAVNVYPNWHLGRFAEAQTHAERGLRALDDVTDKRSEAEQRLYLLAFSEALWALGKPEGCLRTIAQGEKVMEDVDHPYPKSIFRTRGAMSLVHLRDFPRLSASLAEGIELAEEHGFSSVLDWAHILQAWLNAQTGGDPGRCVEDLQAALNRFLAKGAGADIPLARLLLAETQALSGHVDAALDAIDDGIGLAERTQELCHLSEARRIKGDILFQRGAVGEAKAELELALAIGQQQQAPGWVLRSAISLARTLAAGGELVQAHAQLAPAYDLFDQGFDSADMRAAAELLAQLQAA